MWFYENNYSANKRKVERRQHWTALIHPVESQEWESGRTNFQGSFFFWKLTETNDSILLSSFFLYWFESYKFSLIHFHFIQLLIYFYLWIPSGIYIYNLLKAPLAVADLITFDFVSKWICFYSIGRFRAKIDLFLLLGMDCSNWTKFSSLTP